MLNINAGSTKAVLTFAQAASDFPQHVDFNANNSFTFNAKILRIRPLFTQSKWLPQS